MKPKKSIHNFEAGYLRSKERLNNSSISKRNKELILAFDKICSLENLSVPRKLKIIDVLQLFIKRYFNKDLDKAKKEELKDAIIKIDSNEKYSYWTKHSYRAVLKKFYKWLVYGDSYKEQNNYPEIISWLRANNSKDKSKVQASDILTENEITKLIEAAEHPRDKAFISMLYELGSRVGEIGNLNIKDITQDKYGYIVDLTGKTGHRTPRIVTSASYLTTWLNVHPRKDDPNAPLWILLGVRDNKTRMNYSSLRALILRLKEKSKIKKRIHAHLFRHTRVTHLLTNKNINESQAKVYFGWVPSSKMLSEYSHIVSQDVNDVILEIHGIKSNKQQTEPKIKQCPRCKAVNPKEYLFCGKCSSVLDVQTAMQLDEKRQESDEFMSKLIDDKEVKELILKKIIDNGMGKELMKIFLSKKNVESS